MHVLAGLSDDLFAPPMVQLINDAEGGIRYWPRFIDPDTVQDWFETLHTRAAWTHMQRPMYDRIVDVPRLLASYDIAALPTDLPLADMLTRVQTQAPAPYSRIGMNLYRDGRDSVAMHSDKLHTLAAGHPITSISLGTGRRMLIRAKTGNHDTLTIDLARQPAAHELCIAAHTRARNPQNAARAETTDQRGV